MKDAFPRGQTAVVSAATFGVGTTPGHSNFDLAAHASVKALAQVGLKPKDVDALFCVVMDETLSGLNFAEYLGVRTRFNDNARTGSTEFIVCQHVAHRVFYFRQGHRDNHTLARRQAVGLNHNRRAFFAHIRQRGINISKHRIKRSGNVMACEKVFRKCFGAFQLRSVLRGAENL